MPTRGQGEGREAETQPWQLLEGELPPPPDPGEETDIVWQQARAHFHWYDRAATRTRIAYQTLKTVALVFAAAVPVVAAASAPPALTASLAAVVVILEGVQQLFQLQTNWITYRSTAEAFRQHAFMYASRVGPYASPETRRDNFAEFVRTAVSDESTRWSSAMQQAPPSTGATS